MYVVRSITASSLNTSTTHSTHTHALSFRMLSVGGNSASSRHHTPASHALSNSKLRNSTKWGYFFAFFPLCRFAAAMIGVAYDGRFICPAVPDDKSRLLDEYVPDVIDPRKRRLSPLLLQSSEPFTPSPSRRCNTRSEVGFTKLVKQCALEYDGREKSAEDSLVRR